MEKQGLNLVPWLVTILSLCVASLSGWLYFSATATATAQQAELSTAKQRFLTETNELRSQLSKLQRQRDSAQQTTSHLQNQLQQITEQLKTSEGKHQQLVNTHNGEIAALREAVNSAKETGKTSSNATDQILSERDQAGMCQPV